MQHSKQNSKQKHATNQNTVQAQQNTSEYKKENSKQTGIKRKIQKTMIKHRTITSKNKFKHNPSQCIKQNKNTTHEKATQKQNQTTFKQKYQTQTNKRQNEIQTQQNKQDRGRKEATQQK